MTDRVGARVALCAHGSEPRSLLSYLGHLEPYGYIRAEDLVASCSSLALRNLILPSSFPTSDHVPPRSFPRPSSSRVPRFLPFLPLLAASLGPCPVEEIRPPLQVFLALATDVHQWRKRRWTNIAANTSSQRHQRRTQACRARACGRVDVHRRA